MKLYPVFILSTIVLSPALRSQNISGVVNTYHKVTTVNAMINSVTLASAAGITPGVKVLIIQMKGATIDNTNTASFGNVTAIGNAGNYEFNYVCAVNGNDVMLLNTLLKTYTVSGLVQLVTVPQYTNAVVTDTLKPAPWNEAAGTGGVLAIEASGSVTLTRPIDASGKGFIGGAYIDHPQPPYNCDFATEIIAFGFSNPTSGYQTGGSKGEGITARTGIECGKGKLANGGGGANNHNSGGAGGSNYGTGGLGGQRSNEGMFNCHGTNPGVGGLALSGYGYANTLANNRVFMGGGGGAGHGNNNVGMPGGNGGGIIFIKTVTVYGNNELIRANGARPYRADLADPYAAGGDGGGGGGGGGVIVADVTNYGSNVNYEARGADGSYSSYTPSPGCFGPGGGGGGGVVWIKGAALAGATANYSGGANGLISVTTSVTACRGLANGATAGSNGNMILNYVPPVSNSPVCVPLAANDLIYFVGKETEDGVRLNWKMRSTEGVGSYSIERSVDKVSFTNIAAITDFSFDDNSVPAEFVYYRLKISYTDGRKLYSSAILIHVTHKGGWQLLRLSPNPAGKMIVATVRTGQRGAVEMNIYNANAQKLLTRNFTVQKGANQLSMVTEGLPRGTYFLVITMDGRRISKSFIKSL